MAKEVVVMLKGGLGNQFFQFVAAYAVAHRNGAKLLIDSYSGFPADPVNRKYSLENYPIDGTALSPDESAAVSARSRVERRYRSYREQIRLRVFKTMYDPALHRMNVRSRAVLEGFWISPRYMEGIEDRIRAQFETPRELSDFAKQTRESMRNSNSVSIHMRLLHGLAPDGKKLSWRYRRGTPFTLSQDYYNRALDHIRKQRGKDLKIFVFSDSPEKAATVFKPDCEVVFVNNPTRRDYEDVYLMNQCRHHIIANSTFSWWGAWLGKADDQIVCAPDYFANTDNFGVTKDVYPPSWHVLRERPKGK
jgi:hypothetical protein